MRRSVTAFLNSGRSGGETEGMQEKEEKTEDEKRREKWFWLCSILSFGRKEKQMLLDFFGTPEEIWQADEREIGEVFWKNEEHKKAFFVKKLPGMRKRHGMKCRKKAYVLSAVKIHPIRRN